MRLHVRIALSLMMLVSVLPMGCLYHSTADDFPSTCVGPHGGGVAGVLPGQYVMPTSDMSYFPNPPLAEQQADLVKTLQGETVVAPAEISVDPQPGQVYGYRPTTPGTLEVPEPQLTEPKSDQGESSFDEIDLPPAASSADLLDQPEEGNGDS